MRTCNNCNYENSAARRLCFRCETPCSPSEPQLSLQEDRHGLRRCLALFSADRTDSTLESVRASLGQHHQFELGACVNHPAETDFAGPFTHAALFTSTTDSEAEACRASLPNGQTHPLILDYRPVVIKQADESLPSSAVRHAFVGKFKPGAPVEELRDKYGGLTESIEAMKGFEWAVLAPQASGGFEYVFVSTFEHERGRDEYLSHPDHDRFAQEALPHIEQLVIFDFIDGYDGAVPRPEGNKVAVHTGAVGNAPEAADSAVFDQPALTKQVRLDLPPDYLAPDGSEIRLLPNTTRGGICHCLLPQGATSDAVQHRNIEELWYVLEGEGLVWRSSIGEPTQVRPGTSLTIPPRTRFQFRNTGIGPLCMLLASMPVWPGEDEAVHTDGYW